MTNRKEPSAKNWECEGGCGGACIRTGPHLRNAQRKAGGVCGESGTRQEPYEH